MRASFSLVLRHLALLPIPKTLFPWCESAGLFFALPATLLGHMVGLGPGVKSILLWAIVALFCLFAAGKWRQPVAEDIGDKSVFWFNSLGDEEQEQWMERLKTSDPSNPPAID